MSLVGYWCDWILHVFPMEEPIPAAAVVVAVAYGPWLAEQSWIHRRLTKHEIVLAVLSAVPTELQ